MGDSSLTQGFTGVNRLCKKCENTCKQFENVIILRCFFRAKNETAVTKFETIDSTAREEGLRGGSRHGASLVLEGIF